MISYIFLAVIQNGVEPSNLSTTGAFLIALNFAIIAISAFSVVMVSMKLVGEFSSSSFRGATEDAPFTQPVSLPDDEASGGMNPTRRKSGKVTRRRPRYQPPAAVPSHAINISISSSADPARNLVSTVERTPTACEPPVTVRKSQPKKSRSQVSKQRRLREGNSGQPASPYGHIGDQERVESPSREANREAVPTVASSFQPSSTLQTLGFERVIEKRTDKKDPDPAAHKASNSIGQQLVEMNRKVRLGG
jgi:hypothetical protein